MGGVIDGARKIYDLWGGLNHNVTVDFVTDTIHAGVASHGLGRGCEVQWLQRQRSTVSFIMRTVSSGRSMRSRRAIVEVDQPTAAKAPGRA